MVVALASLLPAPPTPSPLLPPGSPAWQSKREYLLPRLTSQSLATAWVWTAWRVLLAWAGPTMECKVGLDKLAADARIAAGKLGALRRQWELIQGDAVIERATEEPDAAPDDEAAPAEEALTPDAEALTELLKALHASIEKAFEHGRVPTAAATGSVMEAANAALRFLRHSQEGTGRTYTGPLKTAKRRRLRGKSPAPPSSQPRAAEHETAFGGGAHLLPPTAGAWVAMGRQAAASLASQRTDARRRPDRRGKGGSQRLGHIEVLFANVTEWSPKAERYFLEDKAQVRLATELHRRGPELHGALRRARMAGLRCFSAPARQSASSPSGSWGGTLAAARSHLCVSPLAGQRMQHGAWESPLQDTAMFCWHCGRGTIIIGATYARHGDTSEVLEGIYTATRGGRDPFIILGDYNREPEWMAQRDHLKLMDAVVIRPTGQPATCTQRGGSAPDYAIVSAALASLVDLRVDEAVPFAPHFALRMTIKSPTKEITVKQIALPKKIDDALLIGKAPTLPPQGTMTWEEAQRAADEGMNYRGRLMSPQLADQQAVAEHLGCLDEAIDNGVAYWRWARANEAQRLAHYGGNFRDEAFQEHIGRGAPVVFKAVPLLPPPFPSFGIQVPGGLGLTGLLLATIEALATRLGTAMSCDDAVRTHRAKLNLICLVAGTEGQVGKGWAGAGAADMAAILGAIAMACRPSAALADAHGLARLAARAVRRQQACDRKKAAESWRAWTVAALQGGAGRAHRWANQENKPPIQVSAADTCEPQRVLNIHAEAWAGVWHRNDAGKVHRSLAEVASFRHEVLSSASRFTGPFTGEAIRAAAARFRKATAIGLDGQEFAAIAEATPESLDELGRVFSSIARSLAWPLQTYVVKLGALAKKAGGTRTVAILVTCYRLLMALMSPEARRWDCAVGAQNDSALKGRSPLKAAAKRQLLLEVSRLRGFCTVLSLWDFATFFDTLDTGALLRAGRQLGYPQSQLALSMLMSKAPRALCVDGHYSDIVGPTGRSILAGCPFSTSKARAYLLAALPTDGPHAGELHRHVDDLSAMNRHRTTLGAANAAVRSGLYIAERATDYGLEISGKSVILGSSRSVVDNVVRRLRRAGIGVRSAREAQDLGVSTAGGERRAVKAQSERLGKAKRRARRVALIVRTNKRGARLYRGGVAPQAEYGAVVQGTPPSRLKQFRVLAAGCAPNRGPQACATTSIAWAHGASADPGIRIPVAQIETWIELWDEATDQEKAEIRAAWAPALEKLVVGTGDAARAQWGRVAGPMMAAQATLRDYGWQPTTPTLWQAPGDMEANLELDHEGSRGEILRAFETSVRERLWSASASHHAGQGLEHGEPGLKPARRAVKWLQTKGYTAEARAAEAAICGAAWPGERLSPPRGCRCGAAVETGRHRYYECPLLADLDFADEVLSTAFQQSSTLRDHFGDGYQANRILWERGMVPASCRKLVPQRIEAAQLRRRFSPNWADVVRTGGVIYPDGAGPPRYSPISEPVVGAGAVAIATDDADEGPLFAQLALGVSGVVGNQTVPRAEAWAIAAALEAIDEHGETRCPIQIRPDAAYTSKGLGKGAASIPRKLLRGRNGDIWQHLQGVANNVGADLTTRRVPSHARLAAALAGGISPIDFVGNSIADKAAELAVQDEIESNPGYQELATWESRAFLATRRIGIIDAYLWTHVVQEKPFVEPLPVFAEIDVKRSACDIGELIAGRGHKLTFEGGWTRCTVCRRRRRPKHFLGWAQTECGFSRPAGRLETPAPTPSSAAAARSAPRAAPVAPAAPADPLGGGVPRQAPATEAARRQTPRQRLAQLADNAAEKRRRVDLDGTAIRTAVVTAMAHDRARHARAPPQPPELEVTSNAPFIPHPSHRSVVCGGFVGCEICGSVSGWQQHGRLVRECAGPGPSGSMGPVRRLRRGMLPHPQRGHQGTSWPDGTVNPRPFRFRA